MSNSFAVANEQILHRDSLGSDRLFYVVAASMMFVFTAIGFRSFYLHRKSCGHSASVRLPSNDAFRRLTFSSSMGNDQSHESMVCTRLCRNRGGMSGVYRSGQEPLAVLLGNFVR